MKRVTGSWKLWTLMVGIMVIGAMALGLYGDGQHYSRGTVGLYEPGQSIYLDNDYSVFGKDTGGIWRAMLTMLPSDNTRLNTGAGKDIIFSTGGVEEARVIGTGIVLANDHSVFGKDTGGTARAMLTLMDTDNTRLNTAPGKDIIFATGGVEKARIASNGKVGIGAASPGAKLHVETASGRGVSGSSTNGYGVYGFSDSNIGLYGESTSGHAGWFEGNVNVTGTLSKAGGAFKIDHPQDPSNKYLSHSFAESPDMMNVYNGNTILDDKGEALIVMPSYFESLNRNFRYQLTCIGGYAPIYVADELSNNQFKIAGGKPGLKVSWQITGIRKDAYANAHPIQVEQEKPANEKGLYLHPRELGQPEDKGINQAQKP